ncbi:DMT family transporter [Rubrobacter indicoceani]|uniref:DMT family transporter n=1 Tax=Rubrobacter indicoceani TaxID=2051957 RepID=UPI000E5B5EE1|nr:DMT family transporter [Rubrobacter indicoceani]
MTTEARQERRASIWVEVSLLLTVFFFATNFVAVKTVVEVVPPVLFAAVRFTLVGLLMLAILRFVEPETRLARGDLPTFIGLGFVGISCTQTVFTIGVGQTTAANTAVIYATAPVWGMLLGFFLKLERPRLTGIVGIALCLFGVVAVQYGGLELAGTSLTGDFLILLAAIFWGSYTVLSIPLLRRYSPLAVAAYSIFLGGLIVVPISLVDLDVNYVDLTGLIWFAALYSALLSSGFGFFGWQRGVAAVGANRVLIYQYLIALTGITAGIILLGETFGPGQVLGAAIILGGVYLARRR